MKYEFRFSTVRTKKALKVAGIILGSLLALALLFVFAFAPARSAILKKQNADFRAKTQSSHDAINSRFNQKDLYADGVSWHYIDEGNPDGEVILLMHGLPEGFYCWDKVIPLLDQNYRIIAIDMKGYGRSSSSDNNYEWHHVGDQTLAFMDALGIDKFHIVGHDWGSIISSVMISDHPDRILSFTRMEADLFPPASKNSLYAQKPQWLLFQNEWIGNFMLSDAKWFINRIYNSTRMLTKMSQEDMDYFIYEFSRDGVSQSVSQYFLAKNWDTIAIFDKIAYNNFSFPVLVLQADSDPAQPMALFEKIPELCKNVELKWITNASHFSTQDQPQQVADAINELVHRIK